MHVGSRAGASQGQPAWFSEALCPHCMHCSPEAELRVGAWDVGREATLPTAHWLRHCEPHRAWGEHRPFWLWGRDEDHLALCLELCGRMPRRVWAAGKYARDFFNRAGELRHIKRLRFWPLPDVLAQKYELPPAEVRELSSHA